MAIGNAHNILLSHSDQIKNTYEHFLNPFYHKVGMNFHKGDAAGKVTRYHKHKHVKHVNWAIKWVVHESKLCCHMFISESTYRTTSTKQTQNWQLYFRQQQHLLDILGIAICCENWTWTWKVPRCIQSIQFNNTLSYTFMGC